MTTPYQPAVPLQTPRHLYRSVAQVMRLTPTLTDDGNMTMSWDALTVVVDPFLDTPGMLALRLDVGWVRPGKDQLPAIVAGRAPDRVAVAFFDAMPDPSTGAPSVLAGDRLHLISGPVFGTWELRVIPDPAQSYTGVHHIEVQVVEVAQSLVPGSPTPFPGSPA